jgi:rRNA maturation endonuclease Nob1
MTTTEQVISELRDLARVYTPVRNQLLAMAVRLEAHLGADERAKWEALGILAVCVECGRKVRPNDTCDVCHPPFDWLPRS